MLEAYNILMELIIIDVHENSVNRMQYRKYEELLKR
jgi:hypothetical protein